MDPNKAFRMKRKLTPKRSCGHCGRTWYSAVGMCTCGNTEDWIDTKPPSHEFDVWECVECGNRRNLVDGWRWLRQNRRCTNCGHSDPGFEMVSVPRHPSHKTRVLSDIKRKERIKRAKRRTNR